MAKKASAGARLNARKKAVRDKAKIQLVELKDQLRTLGGAMRALYGNQRRLDTKYKALKRRERSLLEKIHGS